MSMWPILVAFFVLLAGVTINAHDIKEMRRELRELREKIG